MHATGPQPSILVGRERELVLLRDHLSAARGGRGGIVLIGGEAGIGKTALAQTLCHEAAQRAVLSRVGRCYDLMETPPYGPWIELFGSYPATGDLPSLPSAFAERGGIGGVASQADLFRQALTFLQALAAQRPVIVLLDDMHWADAASLDLLRFIARSVGETPLLLLVTYRSDELTRRHPLYQLLPLLERESHAVRLDLRRLSPEATRSLVAGGYPLADDDRGRLVTWLDARAAGNAFFLLQLLRALEEEGVLRPDGDAWAVANLDRVRLPMAVRQVIDGRLARLGEDARRLLAIAAVIGQNVPLDAWAAIGAVDEDAVLDLAERAEESHILAGTSHGDAVTFAHALIREALYEGVPSMRRRRLHRAAGAVLAASRSPDPDAVAGHFQRADDERALPWLLQAGERAQRAYAWVTAAARFEAALAFMERAGGDTEERGWLLYRLARMLRYVDGEKALAIMDEAMALGAARGDDAFVAQIRAERGLLGLLAGNAVIARSDTEAGATALAALADTERARLAVRLHATADAHLQGTAPMGDARTQVIAVRAFVGQFRAARELGEQILAEAVARGEIITPDGHAGLARAYAALGMPDEASQLFALARDGQRLSRHYLQIAYMTLQEIEFVALPYRTEDVAGRSLLTTLAEEALTQASGALPDAVSPRLYNLPLMVLEGQWEEGAHIARAAAADERSIAFRRIAVHYLAVLAHLRGDAERAWWAIREMVPTGSATEPGTIITFYLAIGLQRVAIALSLDAGDLSGATSWLEAHDRWLAWSGAVLGLAEAQMLWAQYYRQTGEHENALRHIERAIAYATAPRQPLALLDTHRLRGELHTDAGRFAAAAEDLAAALRLAASCAAPYERALTLLALVNLRIASGELEAARVLLDEVRAICEPLGARPALARADALLTRCTAVPGPIYPAGLSAREVEVLRLVAEGLSNARVGERLFVSPRTVEQHLRSIFNKTGVASRVAAARWATEHGLV